jgi:hypothetical protein
MGVPAMGVGVGVFGVVLVRVVAVDNVRWNKLVQHPRDDLDADETDDKAHHDEESALLVIPAGLGEIFG